MSIYKLQQRNMQVNYRAVFADLVRNYSKEATLATFCCLSLKAYMHLTICLCQ
jgi:hypothetical protein